MLPLLSAGGNKKLPLSSFMTLFEILEFNRELIAKLVAAGAMVRRRNL